LVFGERRSTVTDTLTKHLQDWINLVLAACLFIAPWVLGYTEEPMAAWTSFISAIVVGGVALAAIVAFTEWEEWLSFALGIWVVLAPWVLGFTGVTLAVWTHVILGVLVAAIAAWEIWQVHHAPHVTA
jgi:hypothetical protein